jgi:hypothetical protein
MMRERPRRRGLRELRLVVPDSRLQSAGDVWPAKSLLVRSCEDDALRWIEAVSEFDSPPSGQ